MMNQAFTADAGGAGARRLIALTGAEARPFLDDLITQNLARLAQQPVMYGGLLTAPGKLISDFFLWPWGEDGVVLDAPAARGDGLLALLKRYRLRRPVQIDVLDGWSVWVGAAPGSGPADPRRPDGSLGYRALIEGAAPSTFDLARAQIEAGVPDLAVDAGPDEVFALEALFEELNGVDFQKGCFVGQETVSRMKRRATTRKKFCRVRFEGPAPAFDTPVTAGAAELGALRSARDGVGVALIRLDRAREAMQGGAAIMAGDTVLRIDAPDWLLWPEDKEPG